MRVLTAEHIASKVPTSRFDEVYSRHAYSDKGKTFIPVVCQRAIGDAEAGQRANKVKAKLSQLDPWHPEFWAAQEESTLSEMRYTALRQLIVNLQMKQMVYLGENQCGRSRRAQTQTLWARLAAPWSGRTCARAPFLATPVTPVFQMFVRDSRDLRVGFTRQDDQDLQDSTNVGD